MVVVMAWRAMPLRLLKLMLDVRRAAAKLLSDWTGLLRQKDSNTPAPYVLDVRRAAAKLSGLDYSGNRTATHQPLTCWM